MAEKPRPNFFIVGAQKCGTTSLSEYLRNHSNIFQSTPKEPYYFAKDFPGQRRATSEDEYLKFFQGASAAATAIGEASAGYLRSSEAIQNIYDFDRNAKIIVMLRNPVDLAYSFHSQMLFGFDEDETDFSRAWELQDERLEGRHIPKRCRTPQFLQYRDVGMLAEQVERLMSIFPRDQVLFLFFEDFVSDTRAAYQEVLRFLGVPDDAKTDFPRLNPGKKHRFPWLFSLLSRRPRWMQMAVDRLKRILGPKGTTFVQSFYSSKPKRAPLADDLREEMRELFRDEVVKISELTGRDLTPWLKRGKAKTG